MPRKRAGTRVSEPKPTRRTRARAPARGGVKRRTDKREAGAGFRLPEDVRPRHYKLHIEVDPAAGREYRGRVEIELELRRPVSQVELHAAELEVSEAELGDQAATIEVQPARETIILRVGRKLPAGRARLHASFKGTLRNDLRGLYAASANDRHYAFSQLEAADARRFFPCFDEPAFKARFSVSVTTRSSNTVISNSPIERVEEPDGERSTTYFRPTPLLSTYLVALAVGELSFSEPVFAGDVPIRIAHIPGNEHLTAFALEAARESLTRLASYFGLDYPYEKLDLVAVPDFEIGAMENAGAVFFRETLLLVDERSVSLAEKKRAAEVICHELAHMWYGNLVTMRWWDDLWLNEAFATWMAFDIVAKWRPEWQMWNDFGHARNSALHLDALDNTHAIYCPVHSPAEATQNFDLITYEKGAAVVRMLERYLGPSTFQKGVRRYIKRHRESNTEARDLWRALGEAAGESVERVVRPFIEQPGFPLVRVHTKAARGKTELLLEQERFWARGPLHKPKASNGKSKAERWAVPWVGRVDSGTRSKSLRQLLTAARARVELGSRRPDFVYGNADEGGFFRPLHHPDDLPALIAALPKLSSSERLGFVHHQWALVRAGYLELDGFLPLIAALADETDPDVLHALLPPCEILVDDIAEAAGPEQRAQLQSLIASTFAPALAELGMDAAADEPNPVRLRRAELLTLCAVIAEAEVPVALGEVHAAAYLQDRASADANLVAPLLTLGARRAAAARLQTYLHASQTDPTPQERRRFRMALADVRDPALVQEVLRICLTPVIPTQDVALVLARLLGNRFAREITFEFVQARWPELRERMPAMLISRLVEALPALRSEAHRKQVLSFFAAHPIPTAARALRQADERFRLHAAFRKRAAPALRRWLSVQKA
ncbi:MAG TPA: M1 family metallopeptidase [Polyangiales bacterium]|nr:M1 family metallopeptidase [Polyangiales bacterium]